jgi:hypothetical protein
MEAFDLHVYLLTVFRQQRCELVDDHLGSQGVVCRCVVNLLTMPLDPTKILTYRPRPVPESFSVCQALLVELEVVPP